MPAGILRDTERLAMLVGSYGSGKTEVSVNLALALAAGGRHVQIADLDLVNPYFRCREARRPMEAMGIRVVTPPPSQEWADLPIVVPEIAGMLHPPAGTTTLFDVGGDDVGARVLASLKCALGAAPYELWQVVNARRPFTDTPEGCLAMRDAIERSSRFKVTGLAVNTHLMEETTPEIVLEGWRLACEVERRAHLPIRLVTVPVTLLGAPGLDAIPAPLLPLRRLLKPPWLTAPEAGLPAARPVPIGRRNGDTAFGTHRN